MDLIECNGLFMSYEGTNVLNGISFSAAEGDFIAVVGENGSGKSTLVKGILGLKQCDAGSICFYGLNRREIGYLPQQTALQRDFPATVSEVVRSGCLNRTGFRPFYNGDDKKRADNAIDCMHLKNVKNRSYRNLSGGQQQRVLLARALAATKKLLLLDEPVSGLDPLAASEMYGFIEKLNKENKVTVLMVSHDLPYALKYANKILHIDSGGGFFGSSAEYTETEFYKGVKNADS